MGFLLDPTGGDQGLIKHMKMVLILRGFEQDRVGTGSHPLTLIASKVPSFSGTSGLSHNQEVREAVSPDSSLESHLPQAYSQVPRDTAPVAGTLLLGLCSGPQRVAPPAQTDSVGPQAKQPPEPPGRAAGPAPACFKLRGT